MKQIKSEIYKMFPKKNPIIFLHAHPDDESFLSSGLIQRLVKLKRNVKVVYCAAGKVEIDKITTIRQKEALNVCKKMHVETYFLDFCDSLFSGKVENCFFSSKDLELLDNFLEKISFKKNQEYVIVSYDENGGYGHKDHLKVHKFGNYLKTKFPLRKVYEVTINKDKMERWLKKSEKLSANMLPQKKYWSKNYGTEESRINYYYKLTKNEVENKKYLLKLHKSQISESEFPLSLNYNQFREIFGTEYFVDKN